MRDRTALVIGGKGIVRGMGMQVTEPAALTDLRNVTLRPGKALRRFGLTRRATFAGQSAVLGVWPIRSQGIGAVLTFNPTSRVVTLFRVAPDGTVGGSLPVWTLPATAGFPRVSLTDVFDRLIIAHDEPTYSQRQATRVFDPAANTIVDLTADLFLPTEPITPVPVRFRGVTRYLSYLVGWGYGSENAGDDNRPEIVRISLPDQPTVFRPEHYFIAGQRGDPVLACYETGGVLAVRKASESYQIFGYDRPSFGIRPVDQLFGVANSRLGVVVGERNYFWSLEGPRIATGGASQDMALPLDLRGALVDGASIDTSEAFACYDPAERAVLFIFGTWGYAWHLEAEEWSYRQYGTRVFSGGILYRDASSSGLGPTSSATFVSSAAPAPSLGSAGAVVSVDVTIAGTLLGGEVLELWVNDAGTWTRRATQAVSATGAQTIAAPATGRFGVTAQLAVRVALSGIGQTGATGSNPDDWSGATRGTRLLPLPVIAARTASAITAYFETQPAGSPNLGVMHFLLDAPDPTAQPQLTYELRHKLFGGADGTPETVPVSTKLGGRAVTLGIDAIRHTDRVIEVRARTTESIGAWVEIQALRWMGPLPYFGVVITRQSTGAYSWQLTAPPEPAYSIDSGLARLQFNVGSGYFDESFAFSFTPSTPAPGFGGTVFNSALVPGRSNTEVAFRARREIVWQGQTFFSIYFVDGGPF